MNQTTCYETRIGNKQLCLQLPETAYEIRISGQSSGNSIAEMVEQTLNEPIEFPPLPLALLNDDHVAIAVEDGVPQENEVILAVVDYLLRHGTEPDKLTIVLGSDNKDWRERLLTDLKDKGFAEIKVVKHEPNNHESHGYIAASESADPIYIQRDLVEAEVVLPIYCVRTPNSPSASDKYGISPSFADASTQHRWNLAWLEDNVHPVHLQEKLSHEAGWLMGVQFAVVVVPASDGSVASILGGHPDHVFQKASEMVTYSANGHALHEANALAIAFVEGDWTQQSWMNVARAAAHADMQLHPDGSMVICCDVAELSQGIQLLGLEESEERLQKRMLNSDLEDAFAAAVLSSIRSRRSIYLMSRLSNHQVESLGLAYISSAGDIERLCHSASSVCVMRSAQF